MEKITSISILTAIYFNALMEQGLLSDKGEGELGGAIAELSRSAEIALRAIKEINEPFGLNPSLISTFGMRTTEFLVDFYRKEREAPDADCKDWVTLNEEVVREFNASYGGKKEIYSLDH